MANAVSNVHVRVRRAERPTREPGRARVRLIGFVFRPHSVRSGHGCSLREAHGRGAAKQDTRHCCVPCAHTLCLRDTSFLRTARPNHEMFEKEVMICICICFFVSLSSGICTVYLWLGALSACFFFSFSSSPSMWKPGKTTPLPQNTPRVPVAGPTAHACAASYEGGAPKSRLSLGCLPNKAKESVHTKLQPLTGN